MKKVIKRFTKGDFRVETMRGSGPGGQKRNKTDSCVRITHIHTGISAYNCDTPSQHRNKEAAFKELVQRLMDHYFPQANKERLSAGTEEVRSYKEDSDIVTDSTGVKGSFKQIQKNGLGDMIEQRKKNL